MAAAAEMKKENNTSQKDYRGAPSVSISAMTVATSKLKKNNKFESIIKLTNRKMSLHLEIFLQ